MSAGPDARSAGEEAVRLVAAAQAWLRASAPHLAPLDEDGRPCSCPLCRAVAGVREADPESVGRWVDAAVAAAGAVLAQAGDVMGAGASTAGSRAGREDADGEPGGDGSAPDHDLDDVATTEHEPSAPTHEAAPREGADIRTPAGQDGARPRGVRRIPLDRENPRGAS